MLIILDQTYVQLQTVKELLGKYMNTDELLNYMSQKIISNVEREKFKQTKARKSPPPADEKRVISSNIKRFVYERDKKCVKCGGAMNLQFDHIKPYALGGKSAAENVRLLCFNCNQRNRITAKL